VKTFKRNAVILTVLLFVCVAAYLNWSYNKKADDSEAAADVSPQETESVLTDDEAQEEAGVPDAGLYYESDSAVNSEYFDTARLNRQQARDAAAATLATVSETDGASQDMIDASLQEIADMAAVTVKEAELENLIIAKDFADCVVFISDDGIKVTVPAPEEGLSAASVAKITDVITTETDFTAADMKIIEVK
jgi:stage III sporulation protein AH